MKMARLARVTFLGRLGLNKAKSVMAVEDEIIASKNSLTGN
ncbi:MULTISPECIES: hypothetical protein [Legionella]|nr:MULTISPECIES: hypothetical protein [Legionella]